VLYRRKKRNTNKGIGSGKENCGCRRIVGGCILHVSPTPSGVVERLSRRATKRDKEVEENANIHENRRKCRRERNRRISKKDGKTRW